jgi:hypothetical protein
MADRFFEDEDALISGGKKYCPKCGCCTLRQIPRGIRPSLMTQACREAAGEEWKEDECEMGLVCARGCTKTQRHK